MQMLEPLIVPAFFLRKKSESEIYEQVRESVVDAEPWLLLPHLLTFLR
jgi:hypothetical protein